MSDKIVSGTAYLIVEGVRYRWNSEQPVNSAKIVAVKQKKPSTLVGDQVAVKVTIQLPAAAFEALQPEALIVVPEELIQHEVRVDAV